MKESEIVNFCLTLWGCDFRILRVIPKPFYSIVLCGKYHIVENLFAKESVIVNFCVLPRGGVISRTCELFQGCLSQSAFLEDITPL